MNIKNLILNNFQQWKTGNIPFTKGLNVLVGDTECGKSTLFRSISSILTGKMPEDYIRKNEKEVEVKIEFDNNKYFRRFRNKKENIADANGLIFERVGKDIPFEYFKILGNTKIDFGNKELNLCLYSQFEPHFFITLSDYDKSKLIGTICGIDIIDKLVDSINKDIRNNNTNIKFLNNQIEEKKKQKEDKENNFNLIDSKYKLLETKINNIQNNYNLLENLSNLSSKKVLLEKDINTYNLKLTENKAILANFKGLNIELLDRLFGLYSNLNKIANDIINCKNSFKQIPQFSHNQTLQLLEKLNTIDKKLKTYEDERVINNNVFTSNSLKLEELKKQQMELLKDFDKCPLCGSILHD